VEHSHGGLYDSKSVKPEDDGGTAMDSGMDTHVRPSMEEATSQLIAKVGSRDRVVVGTRMSSCDVKIPVQSEETVRCEGSIVTCIYFHLNYCYYAPL
jgi:hypothetical protein